MRKNKNSYHIIMCNLILVIFFFLIISCREREGRSIENSEESEIIDLDNFGQFQQFFKSDSGNLRLIVLLSPN